MVVAVGIKAEMEHAVRRGQMELEQEGEKRQKEAARQDEEKRQELAQAWAHIVQQIKANMEPGMAMHVQIPDVMPSGYNEHVGEILYYPVRLNLPGAAPIRIWWHNGNLGYAAANLKLDIDEVGGDSWFVAPTWGDWMWGKSAGQIRGMAQSTTLWKAVAMAVEAEQQRKALQAEADRRNQEIQNPQPTPAWFEEPLAEQALKQTRAGEHAAAQIFATLALAAEVRNLRLMIANGDPHLFDALKEDVPLFGPPVIRE